MCPSCILYILFLSWKTNWRKERRARKTRLTVLLAQGSRVKRRRPFPRGSQSLFDTTQRPKKWTSRPDDPSSSSMADRDKVAFLQAAPPASGNSVLPASSSLEKEAPQTHTTPSSTRRLRLLQAKVSVARNGLRGHRVLVCRRPSLLSSPLTL